MIRPSCTITEPIGMPPSARPASASAIAAAMNSSTRPLLQPQQIAVPAVEHALATLVVDGGGDPHDAGGALAPQLDDLEHRIERVAAQHALQDFRLDVDHAD